MSSLTFSLYSPPAVERLSSGLFQEVIITNTIPVMEKNYFPQLTVLSVANLLGETIWRVHDDCSVSSIFQWFQSSYLVIELPAICVGGEWFMSLPSVYQICFLVPFPLPPPLRLPNCTPLHLCFASLKRDLGWVLHGLNGPHLGPLSWSEFYIFKGLQSRSFSWIST